MRGILAVAALIIALLFILIEAGIGFRRGVFKSLARAGMLLVIGIILFFAIPWLAETVILLVVNQLAPGEECTTLAEAAKNIVDMTAKDADITVVVPLVETLLAVAATIVIPLLFVVAFWLLKLISWPVFALVCRWFEKDVAPEEKQPLTLNSKLYGAGVGIVMGAVLGAITFMPVAQLSKSIEPVGQECLQKVSVSGTVDACFFWPDSLAAKFYETVQLDALSSVMYRSLAKVEIRGREYTQKDLDELLAVVPEAIEVVDVLDGFQTEKLAEAVPPAKALVNEVFELSVFSDKNKLAALRYAAEQGLQQTESNPLTRAVQSAVNKMTLEEIENDIVGIMDVVVLLDKYGLMDVKSIETLDTRKLEDGFAGEFADAVYELKLAETVVPAMVDMLLEELLSELGVAVVPCGKIENFQETKDDFKELIELLLEVSSLAGDMEKNASMEKAKELLEKICKLQDSPFVSEETGRNITKAMLGYADVKDTIQREMKKQLEQQGDMAEEDILAVLDSVQQYVESGTADAETMYNIMLYLEGQPEM